MRTKYVVYPKWIQFQFDGMYTFRHISSRNLIMSVLQVWEVMFTGPEKCPFACWTHRAKSVLCSVQNIKGLQGWRKKGCARRYHLPYTHLPQCLPRTPNRLFGIMTVQTDDIQTGLFSLGHVDWTKKPDWCMTPQIKTQTSALCRHSGTWPTLEWTIWFFLSSNRLPSNST